jgi:hypothetical protein
MRATKIAVACLAIIALVWVSIRLNGNPQLKAPPPPGYQSPANAVAGFTGNEMRHRTQAACRYSLPGDQGLCAMAVESIFVVYGNISGTWTVGHVVTAGNRAIVDVELEACQGGNCLTNTNPNAGLPGSGTSFSSAFRQALANFDYATDCVRLHGRWYVDNVSGPSS